MARHADNAAGSGEEVPDKRGRKVRVPFRRNRSSKARVKDWTGKSRSAEHQAHNAPQTERVVAKGDQSRQRTIIVHDDPALRTDVLMGTVLAVRGLYADVDHEGATIPCTIRRILRTRRIDERSSVTVGDLVRFRIEESSDAASREGAIEAVEPRHGILHRRSGKRTQIIAVNVDQAVIVSSANDPWPKPHLIDRYIVSALFGDIVPIICMNKIDLDVDDVAGSILDRYESLGYRTIRISAASGVGVNVLRDFLHGKSSVIAGQSGVGKSSLLNSVQPGLALKTAVISEQSGKGKHTTTTAILYGLTGGGYVVDTPGIRSFDMTLVPAQELEAYFVEFIDRVAGCKFPDCSHTHEEPCAIKDAVNAGEIHPDRYASYVELYEDASAQRRY
ncbi:MAG: ribosome small subunit-dependent GTPase A [Planctomycetes bacterium]|nr:ribosome small subunit-dependent GTPase A [Planctomycetota bacterium]MBI3834381.1 ribosome small subunit-dependent GTPase A [Planctomycetota bacterium]